jgi:hypothetical protein
MGFPFRERLGNAKLGGAPRNAETSETEIAEGRGSPMRSQATAMMFLVSSPKSLFGKRSRIIGVIVAQQYEFRRYW